MDILTADNLCDLAGVAHGFFTRRGGVSEGVYASLNCGPGSGDHSEAVAENRRRALNAFGNDRPAHLVTLYQIHSAEAVSVGKPWKVGEAPRADAMATKVPGIALGILTADCAPVLMADAKARVIGAAHAGWRGALSGVVEAALDAMEKLGADRRRVVAAVGPCISQSNYEVAGDFRSTFLASNEPDARFFSTRANPGHWNFDLSGFAQWRLSQARVDCIRTIARCTYASEHDFFSFRRATHRNENDYGRQLSAIMLR
jgi:YfiH family protein